MTNSVAIVGEFASGKTTLANILIENFGFERVSFATRLKDIAAEVYGGGSPLEKTKEYEVWPLEQEPGQYSGRAILQTLGQSVKELDRLFWVRWLLRDIDEGRYGDGPYVTDDCRFVYEADALRERGFVIARILTPVRIRMQRYEMSYGRIPTMQEMMHPSETEVARIEWDILLDGTRPVNELAATLIDRLAEADAA